MAILANIHPGEILLEEYLKPMELSQTRLAREIGVPPRRINETVLAKGQSVRTPSPRRFCNGLLFRRRPSSSLRLTEPAAKMDRL
jgi:hypothetical protein